MDIRKIENADTKFIGKKIKYFVEIESTHKYAKEYINEFENGTIIIAEKQTGGVGTKGRTWYTGKNRNIAMSIALIKPNKKVIELTNLTINIAKAIQESILQLFDIKLDIKKPNDLLLHQKKVCGILTEISSIGEKVKNLIISIGLDVNETEFPNEISDIVTSLKKEFNEEFPREEIIINIIKNIEKLI